MFILCTEFGCIRTFWRHPPKNKKIEGLQKTAFATLEAPPYKSSPQKTNLQILSRFGLDEHPGTESAEGEGVSIHLRNDTVRQDNR